MTKILIKNGTIVNADKTFKANILVESGKIIRIDKSLDISDQSIQIIDAENKYVIPGGIDPHVHLNLPTPAGYSCDNFYSGTRAAIAGGTTTIIDFVTPESRTQSLIEALNYRKAEAADAACNYAFHLSPLAWNKEVADDMYQCVSSLGIPTFKCYMAYQDTIGIDIDQLRSVMNHIASLNGIILVHAENGYEITQLQNEYLNQGKASNKYHALSRPAKVEESAVAKLIELVEETNCKTYVVHTSSGKSLDLIKNAFDIGLPIYAETCPQYLMFNQSKLDQDFYKSAPYVFSPALHEKKHNELLWQGLANGSISTIGTDHCPFNLYGQKDIGIDNFTKVPNGIGGIEHRLELLYTFGVETGKISMQQYVQLVSFMPAKLFGIAKKGAIQENYDADLVIWNPKVKKKISIETQWQNCDHNAYEGIDVKGEAECVILNGKLAYQKQLGFNGVKGKFIYRYLMNT